MSNKIFKNTIFARILIFNIVTICVSIAMLGTMQVVLVNNYLSEQRESDLIDDAESIVSLIENNIAMDSLSSILRGFSKSSHSHIMVINNKGGVIVNTPDSGFADNSPAYLGDSMTKTVLDGKQHSIIGTMGGLFKQTMFTLQIPVQSDMGAVIGAVLVSVPMMEYQNMNRSLFRIILSSIFLVVTISIIVSYILAKRISAPLKCISSSVKEFTKGKLDSRVGSVATESSVEEIAELATSLNEMAYELERVDNIRNSFISDVSHELRTPMTTIGGFVTGMLDDTIPQEKQKEYLKIVSSEISRLSRLVNTFLDISKLQSKKIVMQKTNFNICEEIRLSVIGLEQRLSEKKISVTLNFDQEDCYVYADADSIKRVITNLLDNAVKFTDEGGEITVTVKPKQHNVVISVKNTGCGIPKEQQPLIFERLYKVDKSRSKNIEGSGIGLYLVKNIIRAHGKNITVKSVEGEYAEFIFALNKGKALSRQDYYKMDIDQH